jgi:hypothetical protein
MKQFKKSNRQQCIFVICPKPVKLGRKIVVCGKEKLSVIPQIFYMMST